MTHIIYADLFLNYARKASEVRGLRRLMYRTRVL